MRTRDIKRIEKKCRDIHNELELIYEEPGHYCAFRWPSGERLVLNYDENRVTLVPTYISIRIESIADIDFSAYTDYWRQIDENA